VGATQVGAPAGVAHLNPLGRNTSDCARGRSRCGPGRGSATCRPGRGSATCRPGRGPSALFQARNPPELGLDRCQLIRAAVVAAARRLVSHIGEDVYAATTALAARRPGDGGSGKDRAPGPNGVQPGDRRPYRRLHACTIDVSGPVYAPNHPIVDECIKNHAKSEETRPAGFEPATFRSGGGRSIP
jgi:hypothetical protein